MKIQNISFNSNNKEIKKFIREHSSLFWYIKEDAKEKISIEFLVETILSYGNGSDVRKLFELITVERAAQIFYKQISRKRINYRLRTLNFFKLYFDRHVQGNTD
jgi:hypothetical protein